MSFSRNPQKRSPRTPSRSKGGGENCHNSFPLVQCWGWIAIKTFLGSHKNWPIFSFGMYQLGLNLLPEKAGSSLENDTLSLNANASTSMLARMCSNWLKFRFHCKNGSTFSFYFNPRESPFLSNANFVILPHQGHIKSVLVCGTLFEKKGCWELVRSLRLKQFLYTTGGLLVITYLLAWVHSKWKIGSFFYNLHLTLSACVCDNFFYWTQNGQKWPQNDPKWCDCQENDWNWFISQIWSIFDRSRMAVPLSPSGGVWTGQNSDFAVVKNFSWAGRLKLFLHQNWP